MSSALDTLRAAQLVLRAGEGRDRTLAGRGGTITAILAEIAETHLARRITFRAADGRSIEIEAGGGRLLRILDLVPADLQPADGKALVGKSALADEDAAAAMACLIAFAESADALTAMAGPIPPAEKPAAGGIGVDALEAIPVPDHLAAPLEQALPEVEQTAPAPVQAFEPEDEDEDEDETDEDAEAEVDEPDAAYANLPEALRARLIGPALHGLAFLNKRGRAEVAAEQKPYPVGDFLRAAVMDHAARQKMLDLLVPESRLVVIAGDDATDPAVAFCEDKGESMSVGFEVDRMADVIGAWRSYRRTAESDK